MSPSCLHLDWRWEKHCCCSSSTLSVGRVWRAFSLRWPQKTILVDALRRFMSRRRSAFYRLGLLGAPTSPPRADEGPALPPSNVNHLPQLSSRDMLFIWVGGEEWEGPEEEGEQVGLSEAEFKGQGHQWTMVIGRLVSQLVCVRFLFFARLWNFSLLHHLPLLLLPLLLCELPAVFCFFCYLLLLLLLHPTLQGSVRL